MREQGNTVEATSAEETAELARLLDIPVVVEVILDRRILRVRDILALDVGSVLTLGRSAGENVDIYVSGVLLSYGEMVVVENSMGVRITDFQREE